MSPSWHVLEGQVTDIWNHCECQVFVTPLFRGTIRYTGGCSSGLLMAVIISKVTNAINMENSLLISRPALGQSSASFNHQSHSLDKQSFNRTTRLCCDTQYGNQTIYRLSDWIQFPSIQWCSGQRVPLGTEPEPMKHETTASLQNDNHSGKSQHLMFAHSAHSDNLLFAQNT